MKNVTIILGAILFASVILTSCGDGKQSDIDILPETTDVKGDLSDYFTVADGIYKLVQGEKYTDYSNDPPKGFYHYSVKVKIERTEEEFDFDAIDLERRGYLSLVCDLFDESGTPVITADREGMRTQGRNSEDRAMVSLKPGESGWAIFSFVANKEEMSKVKKFEVSSNVDIGQASSISDFSSEIDDSESSTDCDQFIKEYTAFVDSYIMLMKKYKANPTDPSILIEYSDAAQNAVDMQSNASNCTDPKYASKLMELANKIAKSAM